jgi:hypothetical protein
VVGGDFQVDENRGYAGYNESDSNVDHDDMRSLEMLHWMVQSWHFQRKDCSFVQLNELNLLSDENGIELFLSSRRSSMSMDQIKNRINSAA